MFIGNLYDKHPPYENLGSANSDEHQHLEPLFIWEVASSFRHYKPEEGSRKSLIIHLSVYYFTGDHRVIDILIHSDKASHLDTFPS